MHPEMLRSLIFQRTRDLREEEANPRRPRGARRLKVNAASTPGWWRTFRVRRAAGPSPVPNTLPAVATAPGPTAMGIRAASSATFLNRSDQRESKAS